MDYVGAIYRPPSEAASLLVQVTVGCSHNRCAFCGMYLGKRFRPKGWEQVEADLREAGQQHLGYRRAFLCDGDALILPTERLLRILGGIREHLPWIERVGVYGDTRCVRNKSVEELRALREAGLGIVYHGVESGDDVVLDAIDKGGTSAECVEMADKLRAAGLVHSVIVLLGIGGIERSERHARRTAELLSAIDPPYVGALVTTVLPGTPLYEMEMRGDFTLPNKFGLLGELRTLVAESRLSDCRFSTNHASNYLPLKMTLPRDRDEAVSVIDEVIAARDEGVLRPEFLRGL